MFNKTRIKVKQKNIFIKCLTFEKLKLIEVKYDSIKLF